MIINICEYKIIIDDEDVKKVLSRKWRVVKNKSTTNNIYFQSYNGIEDNKKTDIRLNRFIMGLKYKDRLCVDHINGNTLDNRKCNLRVCTHQQNMFNSKGSEKSAVRMKGVSIKGKKFHARIVYNGKEKSLGLFNCPTRAWFEYIKASLKLHGEYSIYAVR